MKRLFLLSSLLLIVCCARHGDSDVRDRLEKWDAEIWNRPYVYGDTLPHMILDSLGTIDSKRLSKKDEAHYNLLWTIAKDKSNFVFEDDSVISRSVAYYQRTEDYRNYSRSLFYKGLVRYRISTSDTTIYPLLKKAEEVYDVNHCKDERLIAIMYGHLGSVISDGGNYELALDYYEKSLTHFANIGDSNNVVINSSTIASILVVFNRNEEAMHILNGIGDVELLPLYLKKAVYSAYSMYYKATKDYDKSLLYKKKILLSCDENDKTPIFYSISDTYLKLNMEDSTVKYLELLSASLVNNKNVNEHRYLKKISDSYSALGYKEKSVFYLEKAYSSLQEYEKESYSEMVHKIERQYDVFKKEMEISRMWQNEIILILFLSFLLATILLATILLATILLMTIIFIQKRRRILNEKESSLIQKELSNKLLFVSCKTIPSLYRKIEDMYVRPDVDTVKAHKDFQKLKNTMTEQFKRDIECVISSSSDINDKYVGFTNYEKAIVVLMDWGFSKEEIASILNTSIPTIRTLLSRISHKNI